MKSAKQSVPQYPDLQSCWYRLGDMTPVLLYDMLALREAIFVVEQTCIYQELDGLDKNAQHLLVTDGDTVVACLRLLPPGARKTTSRIGRVAVSPAWRKQGLARWMVQNAIEKSRLDYPSNGIYLDAQTYLRGFYTSLGFQVCGDEFIEELEEILITADFGMQTTQSLMQAFTGRLKEIDPNEPGQLHAVLGEEIRARLKTGEPDWPTPDSGPLVIMVVGVNGVGKTTTIGKLAKQFADQGKKVVLGAGDTFRAAAAEQLEVWGERSGAEVVRHAEGSDPAAVAFDSAKAAVARNADVLILDTAGRLHTKVNLMEELKKVRRVVDREIPGAPHEILLVLDATTGQNALIQARTFQVAVEVSGIALTKLDGTAKGGIVVAISSQLDLPVRFIGVGEGVADLRPFDADEFVAALFANN